MSVLTHKQVCDILYKTVIDFRDKHAITCAESIYQRDERIADAYELIETLIETVGYYENFENN